MTGIYTGGTMNFNALGASLGVDKTVMAIVLAFEMVLTTPYIFFIIGGGYKVFRKILPYDDITRKGRKDEDIETKDIENYQGMLTRQNAGGMFIGLGLSVLFLAIGAGLALLLTGTLNELVVILTITTLSIIASFFKKVRELPKTFELGMFFILIFSVIVASLFDIHSVNGGSLMIGLFVGWVMIVAAGLHLLLCRVMHVSGDLFCVSQIALLCSPPFVPPVVGAMKNKKVLISGIAIGLVGYAIGTYLGVLIAYVLN
jgi:Predicted integral membrane protein